LGTVHDKRHIAMKLILSISRCLCLAPASVLALLLGGCGDVRVVQREGPLIQRGEARDRKVLDVDWTILWERGGSEADTALLYPADMAVDATQLYVFDAGPRRLVALGAEDGQLRWMRGRRGGGPGEFEGVGGVFVTATRQIMVSDPRNVRVAVMEQDGETVGYISLQAFPFMRSGCPLSEGGFLASGVSAPGEPPLSLLTREGIRQRDIFLPGDPTSAAPGLYDGFLVPLENHGGCFLLLRAGEGFIRLDSEGQILSMHPYVEWFPLPEVERFRGPRGAPPTYGLKRGATAARGGGVADGTLAVAYGGGGADAHRIIDFYDVVDGRYLYSYRAPIRAYRVVRHGDRFYFRSERNGYPLIMAARVTTNGPPGDG
jgi:hypothetical protein